VRLDPRNARVSARLARPYALDRSFSVVDGHHSIVFSPASGLISSVSDLARFDIAIENDRFLPEAARELQASAEAFAQEEGLDTSIEAPDEEEVENATGQPTSTRVTARPSRLSPVSSLALTSFAWVWLSSSIAIISCS